MKVTLILTLILCLLLFLMIWSAAYFLPWKGLMDFFPEDIKAAAIDHKPPFSTAPVFGWICMVLCMLGFLGVALYGGYEGMQKGYTFVQFFLRFLIMLYGLKVFDIVCLDYFLITKTQFFQHYLPETKGCAGYNAFGYNRKEQIKRIILIPFEALFMAVVCTVIH